MRLVELPSSTHPPAGHKPDKTWRRAKRQATRREFIRLATGASIATGLAFASLMPTSRRAYAHTSAERTLLDLDDQEAGSCHGPGTPPYPLLVSGTGCCRCGSDVSDEHCGSDDWHRHDFVQVNEYQGYQYDLRHNQCGNDLDEQDRTHAWLWQIGGVGNGGQVWRCSDGWKKYCVNDGGGTWACGKGSSHNRTVCPYRVS